MILPIFNSMKAIPNNILQASNDLGASTFTTFRKVIVPLTREGIKTGVQVTFIPALSLFMITRLIAGNKVINVGTAIEEQFLTIQNYGLGSTIALFLIIFMAFLLIITKSKSSNGKGISVKWYGKLYIALLISVLYIPIFFLMIYSFNSAGNMSHFEHFTLEHYHSLFHNDRLMSAFLIQLQWHFYLHRLLQL